MLVNAKQVQYYKFRIAENPTTTITVCLIDKFIKYDYKQDIILLLIFYRNMTRIRVYMRIDGYNRGVVFLGWKVINVHKSNKQYNFRMKNT